jgi:hypothetical protein
MQELGEGEEAEESSGEGVLAKEADGDWDPDGEEEAPAVKEFRCEEELEALGPPLAVDVATALFDPQEVKLWVEAEVFVDELVCVAEPTIVAVVECELTAVLVAELEKVPTAEPVAVEEQVARFTAEPGGHSEGQPQSEGALAPSGQYEPAVQLEHVDEPPELKVPAAHAAQDATAPAATVAP